VFAGAAREAVFSNPDVIRRANSDFVPIALKAGLVDQPPDNDEGRLYREIARSRPAPQGICVVNSVGKVLDWALMFDDEQSVLAFLDHSLQRFAQFPDAKKPVPAERYTRFPSQKLEDTEDSGKVLPVADHHPDRENCPAKPRLQKGTLIARVYGRALDPEGKPLADTLRQENYVEDRFNVPVTAQESLAKALAAAGTKRFPIQNDLAKLLVSRAFLGQLDVSPFGGVPGSKSEHSKIELWGIPDGTVPGRLRIEGTSEASGVRSTDGEKTDRRVWQHRVQLTWDGIIDLNHARISRLLLVARGVEKLKWGIPEWGLKGKADVTLLMAGHAIDLIGGVRYGIIGEPVAANEATDIPDEARQQLVEALGGPFLVFRDKVQKELKLSNDQKQRLLEKLPDHIQQTMRVLEKIKDMKDPEREQEMQPHRQESHQKLAEFLKEALKEEQLSRLRQLELQQAGPFALGRPDMNEELKLTDEQKHQFMTVILELQRKIAPLIQEAQSGGNALEIWPKIMKTVREHKDKIKADGRRCSVSRSTWTIDCF
jgi:hypothetical protein